MKKLTFKHWYSIIALVVLSGCTAEKKEKEVKIGEYVYIDRYECIHINQRCYELNYASEEDGEGPRYMVYREEVKNMHEIGRTCSNCVTDEAYKELEKRIKQN